MQVSAMLVYPLLSRIVACLVCAVSMLDMDMRLKE